MAWRKLCQELVLHPSSFAGRRGADAGADWSSGRCCWVVLGAAQGGVEDSWVPRPPSAPMPCRAPSCTRCAPTSSLQSSAPPGACRCSSQPPAQRLGTVALHPGTVPMTLLGIKVTFTVTRPKPPEPPCLEPQIAHVGR